MPRWIVNVAKVIKPEVEDVVPASGVVSVPTAVRPGPRPFEPGPGRAKQGGGFREPRGKPGGVDVGRRRSGASRHRG